MDDQGRAVVAESGQLGERLLHGWEAWGLDICHPPVRVELLHEEKAGQQNDADRQSQSFIDKNGLAAWYDDRHVSPF
jgi:hypothetical protein